MRHWEMVSPAQWVELVLSFCLPWIRVQLVSKQRRQELIERDFLQSEPWRRVGCGRGCGRGKGGIRM